MKCTLRVLFLGWLTVSVGTASLWAQATAQITGTVRDQTGAVLPGVEIAATHTDTSVVRNALTDETGSYVLANLPTGPYRLEAGLPGFKTFVQTGIVLQVNSNPVIPVVLEIGQITDQVEVQANAALVETRSVGVGQVMENERILELPLNGRNLVELVTLSGAAVQVAVNTPSQGMQGYSLGISVAGGLSSSVSYVLDGAMHNAPWNGTNLPFPFPDALQEFKVETGATSAQNGMHAAGSVNSVTKSGTNDIHGDAFEFVRNDLFNARNFFAEKNSTLKRNQFGGTVGGPIVKNRMFYFAGYQGTTTRQDPASSISFIPTEAMLAGDFTAPASAACRSAGATTLKAPFGTNGLPANKIDPALYSKPALAIASKLPKTDDPCGRYVWGSMSRLNEWQTIAKIDYQLSPNHAIFSRWMGTHYATPPPYELTPDNILATTTGGRDNFAQAFTIGGTYLISPNTINSMRFAGNRTAVHRTHKTFFDAPELGIKAYSAQPHYMIMSITSGFSLGGGTENDATFHTATFQAGDDLNLIRGAHQIAFGGVLANWQNNIRANNPSAGSYNFNGTITGHGLADFLTGKLNTLTQAAPNSTDNHQWYMAYYGQDTWKATPRLTLNYGLRWEPFFPQKLNTGHIYAFDYDRFQAGVYTTQFKNAPAGFYYPGDPGFPGKSGQYKQWKDFGPRVGLAWDVKGDGRTSVRASWATFFDFVPGQFQINNISPPWGGRVIVTTPSGGFDDPWSNYAGGNPFPWGVISDNLYTPNGSFTSMKYDTKTETVQSWTLSVQKQIGTDWIASTSYLGNLTTHVWTARELNPAVYFFNGTNSCVLPNGRTITGSGGQCSTTTNLNDRRVLTLQRPADGDKIGILGVIEDGGTANYHGMLLSLQRRPVKGVSVSGNYTWSHCITDLNVAATQPNGGNYIDDRNLDRSNCPGDTRHILNLTSVAETPRFNNPTLRNLATGWRLSVIYRQSTGPYLTLASGVDAALNGIGTQRATQVLENPYGDKSLTNYLNPKAFVQPAPGEVGAMGRSNILAPGTWQLDSALSRIFRFRETQRIEVRAEAFNLTNSLRKGSPNATLNSNTFGQITTASDPRIMQFALKYVF